VADAQEFEDFYRENLLPILCAREARRRRWPVPTALDGPDEVDRALLRHDVAWALAGLSVQQRQTVVLRDWAGFGTDEVARMLAVRESTVRVHLARGRAHLREALRVGERGVR
jgi:RNA polymerase sigma factor (sigma-70 family)